MTNGHFLTNMKFAIILSDKSLDMISLIEKFHCAVVGAKK